MKTSILLATAAFLVAPALAAPAGPPQRAASLRTAAPGSREEIQLLLATAPKAIDYPNASKATVYDFADITVRPDGSARTVTRQTIKVFNKRGRDQESEVRIPYHGGIETIKIVRARTIRPDGSVVDVKPADIRDEAPNGYDDARTKLFSMPAVDDDCLIDYEYITEQKTSQLPGHFWSQWYFQGGIDPVIQSRLTLTLPRSLTLHQKLRHSKVEPILQESADKKSLTYRWEDRNVAPIEIEPLMPEAERVLPKLTLSTIPDWQTVAEWYASLARDRATADEATRARARELTKDLATPEEKARALFYYVQEKTRPVAIELGIGAYQPRPAGQTLLRQYGDCKDMATLLEAMLRSVGITAYPALLEAGSPYPRTDELPAPSAFNHAICLAEINGKKYWLDATAQVCPWGQIPGSDRGAQALVIRDGKGVFETIPVGTPEEAQSDQQVKLTLAADGSAAGTVTLSGNGDSDMALRATLLALPPDRVQPFLEILAKRIGANARVTRYSVSDIRNRDLPVTIAMEVSFPGWANISGSLLLFKARPDQTAGAVSNPFSQESRTQPVAQRSPQRTRSVLEVTLPEGFVVLSVPENASGNSDLGRFERSVQQNGRTLTIATRVEDFGVEVPPSRYQQIRAYYDRYLKTWDESVVVKKG